jgi:GDP-L-fucose synthase
MEQSRVREDQHSVELWGSGDATREFLYVEDAATAIVLATERYDSPEPMNIGTGVETSIAEVAIIIAELYGFEGRIEWDDSRPDGVSRRRLDIGRAWATLGFLATTSLTDGLKATVEWYEGRAV